MIEFAQLRNVSQIFVSDFPQNSFSGNFRSMPNTDCGCKHVNFQFKAELLIKLVPKDYLTLLPLGLINLVTLKVYLKQTGPQ